LIAGRRVDKKTRRNLDVIAAHGLTFEDMVGPMESLAGRSGTYRAVLRIFLFLPDLRPVRVGSSLQFEIPGQIFAPTVITFR
jgi:hypothetical protein